jgi:hypothetical protein
MGFVFLPEPKLVTVERIRAIQLFCEREQLNCMSAVFWQVLQQRLGDNV